MGYSFLPTQILLPKNEVDLQKWSVIACDQYTSNKNYWDNLTKEVADNPSTLHMIYPEVYLNEGESRIHQINDTMNRYLKSVLETKVENGFVLVSRETKNGQRLGLVGVIDLENYDYNVGSTSKVRATEGTIHERIPPRQAIRRDASLELPHIIILLDDVNNEIIEPLYEHHFSYMKLYDFDLNNDGGHISGYAIDGDKAVEVQNKLQKKEDQSNGFFLAVGDGNHSLATAKACWEEIKVNLSKEEQLNHPARYAMVEMVNLHSDAIVFEPIHRVIYNCEPIKLLADFDTYLANQNMMKLSGKEITFVYSEDMSMEIDNKKGRLPVDVLQSFLDEYFKEHPESSIDYIHGEEELRSLINETTCGFLLNAFKKENLFSAIVAGGVLPRKTFSMGEANEKRYYLESRKIVK